ncbi:nucleotide modification associated domain-containing protein [Paenibacillus naphthalenovorans]|uniref:nucleotide modification associated domain-containing protein n=1 Tax=Paenibacillus naphthalenovorans TaxID=162209 RepID=UPI003D281D61
MIEIYCACCGESVKSPYGFSYKGTDYIGHKQCMGAPMIRKLTEGSRMETQEKRIEIVISEVGSTLIRKNRDYGDSFAKQFAKYGALSGLIRMDDKMRRLENLVGGAEQNVDESIEDTLMDLAGYAILCVIELRKKTGVSADGQR